MFGASKTRFNRPKNCAINHFKVVFLFQFLSFVRSVFDEMPVLFVLYYSTIRPPLEELNSLNACKFVKVF